MRRQSFCSMCCDFHIGISYPKKRFQCKSKCSKVIKRRKIKKKKGKKGKKGKNGRNKQLDKRLNKPRNKRSNSNNRTEY